jgi:hypothetical protein
MQTEIDQFLTEQNSLLMQQNNLLAAKQGFESTSRFIKDHLDRLQRSRAELQAKSATC